MSKCIREKIEKKEAKVCMVDESWEGEMKVRLWQLRRMPEPGAQYENLRAEISSEKLQE